MRFILVQNDVTRDIADTPAELDYSLCDDARGWSVCVGETCVAKVHPCRGCRTWLVTSEQDGYKRPVGALDCAADYIERRLSALYLNDRFEGSFPFVELIGT